SLTPGMTSRRLLQAAVQAVHLDEIERGDGLLVAHAPAFELGDDSFQYTLGLGDVERAGDARFEPRQKKLGVTVVEGLVEVPRPVEDGEGFPRLSDVIEEQRQVVPGAQLQPRLLCDIQQVESVLQD